MRSAAERSVTGMHPVFVYRFASEANPSWECVCRRFSQSSMLLMIGRLSSGVLAAMGAATCLGLWSAVGVRWGRACG